MDKPWKVVLAFTGIFLAGVLVGGMATIRWGRNFAQRQPMGEQFAPRMMERLTSELQLTADQQAKIRPIIDARTTELRQLRRTTQKATANVLEHMQSDIAAQLTPEQKAKFEEQLKKQRERMRRFMEERAKRFKDRGEHGGPGGPGEHGAGPGDGPPPDDKH